MNENECKIVCPFADKIDEMHKDIKALLRFKWQIMGGAAAIGTIIAFVITFYRLFK